MDKNVLIVTGSDYSPCVYQGFKDVKGLGCKLYLLSDGSFEPKPGIFEGHYSYDLRETKKTLDYMASQPVKFDAVTIKTSEWLTPLTALLAKHYGCIGNDPIVAFNCRSKYHMRKKLNEASVPIPKYKLCKNYDEIVDAINEIGTPCVAKPVGGNASYGTFMIRDEYDLKKLKLNYDTAIEYLKKKAVSEDIFAFNKEEMDLIGISDHVDMVTDYLVEEYMKGPEISIDAITQKGKVTIFGIADQIRMKPPYFIQLFENIPYLCDQKDEKIIIDLIKKTHEAMDIKNSASHTEIIFTPEGPKIVEIACRIGGDNIHDAVYEITGYNLMFESIMIALGLDRTYGEIPTKCHTAMQYLLPTKSGIITDIVFPKELENNPNVIEIYNFAKIGDKVSIPPFSFDFLGYITVKGKTPDEAQINLKKAVEAIKFFIE